MASGGMYEALADSVEETCAKAASICQRLLTAAGRAQSTRARIDLAAVVVEVAQLMASSLPPGARLSTEVAGPANIEGDAGAIQSILMNLVTNAAESLEGRPGQVSVSVDVLEWGFGTAVAVLLPLAKPPQETGRTDESTGPPRAKRGAGRTILLADDEDALRRSVGKILEAAGYRVIAAKDGLEAIAAWRDHKMTIDVALLDAVMPHAGGIAAAIEIRNAGRHVPIVIMTGYTVDDIAAEGVTVLTKPFTSEVLLGTLDRVMAG